MTVIKVRDNIREYIFDDGEGMRLSLVPLDDTVINTGENGCFKFKNNTRVVNLDILIERLELENDITFDELTYLCESVLQHHEAGVFKL